jgi:hypothetical protein
MNLTFEQITQQALALPVDIRTQLANVLLESLDTSFDKSIQHYWTTEACRRRDEIRNGQVKTIAGDEALKRVRMMFTQ